jgi:sulfur-carrier protein adenylyltransferase/sulfurtransferase
MAHLLQVGAGSGGMPVLDMVCRDRRIDRVTLVEPDVYKPHNVERHLFATADVGAEKGRLAQRWLHERRPDLRVDLLACDLLDPARQGEIEEAARACDLGVCAADNEPAKFYFDTLMRRAGKPWTLGEVLAGGIGGFVHRFVPGGPCYGCVASHLKRPGPDHVAVEKPKAPDYSQPGGAVAETTVPAGMAAIHAVASLHALWTLGLLDGPGADPGCTSLLWTLARVPGVFEEAFRPYRFRVARLPGCLVCGEAAGSATLTGEELDVALNQALARLADE